MNDADFLKWRFDTALGDRIAWWSTARALREAAEHLYAKVPSEDIKPRRDRLPPGEWTQMTPSTGMKNTYVLLVGLSLENLLKGEFVRSKPGAAIVDGGLTKAFATHDLVKLADDVGLRGSGLAPEEERVLQVATEACGSWGRYPGGVSYKKGDIGPPDDLDLEGFRRAFEALFDRLEGSVMQGIDDSRFDLHP